MSDNLLATAKGAGRNGSRGDPDPPDPAFPVKPMVLWAAAVLVLSVVLSLFLGSGKSGPDTTALITAMKTDIARLGERVARLEAGRERLSRLEKRTGDIGGSVSALRRSLGSQAGRLEDTRKAVSALRRKVARLSAGKAAGSAAVKSGKTAAVRYHRVRAGESLYRIALKYRTSVAELLRLNHMTRDQTIHPGQKLRVP